jgi:hypothetical protein
MEIEGKLIILFEKYAPIINPLYRIYVIITYIGGPLASLWVLWMTYTSGNISYWFSFIVLLSIVIAFKFGMAPLLAVACSWIYYYDNIGLWLPIISYVMAIAMLILQLGAEKIIKSQRY